MFLIQAYVSVRTKKEIWLAFSQIINGMLSFFLVFETFFKDFKSKNYSLKMLNTTFQNECHILKRWNKSFVKMCSFNAL